jgi:outer membrane protein assembly factor BamB
MELRRRLLPLSVLAVFCAGTMLAAQRSQVRPTGTALDLAPFGARTLANTSGLEIAPILAGEFVLVSSTRRLLALDAATGALGCWSTPALPGWEALEPAARNMLLEGVDPAALLVQAAAGERVTVVSLQLPFSRSQGDNWQGIPIMTALPERRLFAFELAGGRPLWSHAPFSTWDGDTGPFEQRMNLIASPLVVGERVLVPCTRDVSSIDYHVACYALDTGRLLWTTFVVRGQVERNMFGRLMREFATAPLVATPDGTAVIAQTGLGRVAALDLGTGTIRWQHEYEAIPVPKTKSYVPPVRRARWRTTAPLVSDGLVLATPRDSEELIVLDLATGRPRGSLTKEWLTEVEVSSHPKSKENRIDHLVGARGDRLYLGGEQLLAVERNGGLGSEAPWKIAWARPIGANSAARAQLVGEHLFVADSQDLLELDARDGTTLRSQQVNWVASFLVTDDAIFTLGRDSMVRLAR